MFVDTQVRPQGEQVDAVAPAKLKLSAAIRIGAKIRPQAFGHAFKNGKSCAWGAAWEGSGHPYEENASYARILSSNDEWIDANGKMADIRGYGIALANDANESRESIADWLEAQGL